MPALNILKRNSRLIISHQSPNRAPRVNEQRAEKVKDGFPWQGALYDIDPDSLRLIMSRAVRLTIDPNINEVEWRTKGNSMFVFSRSQFLEFAAAADAYVESLYQASWQQKQ